MPCCAARMQACSRLAAVSGACNAPSCRAACLTWPTTRGTRRCVCVCAVRELGATSGRVCQHHGELFKVGLINTKLLCSP
jgi:hypothetical protein